MNLSQTTNTLSNEVEQELEALLFDENFNTKTQQVFQSISEKFSSFLPSDYDSMEMLSENPQDFFLDDSPFYFQNQMPSSLSQDLTVPSPFNQQVLEQTPETHLGERHLQLDQCITQKQAAEPNKDITEDVNQSEGTCKSQKCKSSRHVVPAEFLSLKRKDVVMKSIFRMMRRYFCKLLEETTSYNRKEKCLKIKHKELLKSIKQGVSKLGFSNFAPNMAFYFAAFAYPSDLRKILEEAKPQFRTQNDVISQALFVVGLVDNCFNRYSKKVFKDVLSVPQFSYMIHYYLSNVDDLSDFPKPFQNCFKTLIQSKDVVDSYDPSNVERTTRNNSFVLKEEFFLFEKSDSL